MIHQLNLNLQLNQFNRSDEQQLTKEAINNTNDGLNS